VSASEKLKALKPEGLVVTDAPYEGYTDAVCLSISTHAAVVAVVEAAEKQRALENPDASDLAFAMADLYTALRELDEALP
jgi:hypothetical protein